MKELTAEDLPWRKNCRKPEIYLNAFDRIRKLYLGDQVVYAEQLARQPRKRKVCLGMMAYISGDQNLALQNRYSLFDWSFRRERARSKSRF